MVYGAASDRPRWRIFPCTISHGADRVLDRHLGIDPMLIVEDDDVDAEPLQARLAGLTYIGRVAPDAEHRALGAARPSELRRHHDSVAAAADRPAD